MADSTNSLAIATLIIYLILIQPVLYCLWKHGKRGFLGYFLLNSFCLLRIIGSAVVIHADATHTNNKNTLLINSIGLSPLLLACAGVLHDARRARNPKLASRLESFLVIQ
ncbi:hypothetical protein ABVK25_006445 [Lepraria finkii]|uniref:DUF7702 domain-containing protein n=1 Tax=Lepraria finkii TaxID=1340010 RepID=A0ABR4B8R7_9LECA